MQLANERQRPEKGSSESGGMRFLDLDLGPSPTAAMSGPGGSLLNTNSKIGKGPQVQQEDLSAYPRGYSYDPVAMTPLQRAREEYEFGTLLSKRLQEHEEMLQAHRKHLEANRAWLLEQKKPLAQRQNQGGKNSPTRGGSATDGGAPGPTTDQDHQQGEEANGLNSVSAVASAIAIGSNGPAGRLAQKLARETQRKEEERRERAEAARQQQLQQANASRDMAGTRSSAKDTTTDGNDDTLSMTAPTSASQNSSPARGSRSRYAQKRETQAQQQARLREQVRRQALAQSTAELKQMEELADCTGAPKISAESQRLASTSRARAHVEGLPIHDSLMARDAKTRAEKWKKQQEQKRAETPARPAITPKAASMHRTGSVGERLHLDAVRIALEKEANQQEAQLRQLVELSMADHSPHITKKGSQVKTSGPHLHALALQQQQRRRELQEEEDRKRREAAHPAVNPQSEAIVSKLEEGTMERLCRPRKEYTAQAAMSQQSFSPRINRTSAIMAEHRARSLTPTMNRGGLGDTRARKKASADDSTSEDSSEDEARQQQQRQQVQVNVLYADANRRKAKLEQLRKQKEEAEKAAASFRPSLAPNTANGQYDYVGGPDFLDRISQWEARRHQRRMEAQALIQEKEFSGCTFAPSIHPAAGPGGQDSISTSNINNKSIQSVESGTIYGGDGKPWGHGQHVDRLEAARKAKEEAEKWKEHVFSSGTKWTGQLTQPKEFQLGRFRDPHEESESRRREERENVPPQRDGPGPASSSTGPTQGKSAQTSGESSRPITPSRADGSSRSHVPTVASLVPPHEVALGRSPFHAQMKAERYRQGEAHLHERLLSQYGVGGGNAAGGKQPVEDVRVGFHAEGGASTPLRDVGQIINHYLQSANRGVGGGGDMSTPPPVSAAGLGPSHDFTHRLTVPQPSGAGAGYDVTGLLGLSPATPARAGAGGGGGDRTPRVIFGGGEGSRSQTSYDLRPDSVSLAMTSRESILRAQEAIAKSRQTTLTPMTAA